MEREVQPKRDAPSREAVGVQPPGLGRCPECSPLSLTLVYKSGAHGRAGTGAIGAYFLDGNDLVLLISVTE